MFCVTVIFAFWPTQGQSAIKTLKALKNLETWVTAITTILFCFAFGIVQSLKGCEIKPDSYENSSNDLWNVHFKDGTTRSLLVNDSNITGN